MGDVVVGPAAIVKVQSATPIDGSASPWTNPQMPTRRIPDLMT
jgi:hypothetical protein